MLRRRARAVARDINRTSSPRTYSQNSADQHVPAIPFAFSKEAAIRHVGLAASVGCLFRNFLGSLGAKYIGGNFQPIQPIRIQPVYFPAWFLDSEVESYMNDGDSERQRTVTAYFNNCYLPGAAFDLLGRLALRNDQVEPSLAVPFSQSLTHQHGSDVVCMPYTINPLDVISRARTSSFTSDEDVRSELRFIKTNIEATYPVLIPLYLAQFPMVPPFESSTFVIEAYSQPGRFFIQVAQTPEVSEEDRFDLEKYIGYDFLFLGDAPSSHAETRVLAPDFDKNASANVASWFDRLFSEPGGAEKLVHPDGAVGVNAHMDDPRVREWTAEEVNPVRHWMNQGQAIVQLKDVVKNLTSIENQMQSGAVEVTQWPPPPESEPKQGIEIVTAGLEAFIKSELSKLEMLEQTRADTAPEWWRQREETKHQTGGSEPM
ncbi:uncharacterized protein EDB91DRAFT_1259462 [Suillus paluster]|uniref:uncharacterized protein n=1 Tax=Suillus paluster TaxID=48578 RepID=UPI001B87B6A1|nr:uncharacterized protein EDB91DRAFT_1259462 [Suillus paluster]KAG1717634.1 hypothetical protein EDB91DRAFT_1259462 [Suillus paluster]